MVKTYDPHCGQLAVHFLADDDMSQLTALQVIRRTDSLALAIQQAVEDWREDEATEAAAQADQDAELRSLRGLSDVERERI